MPDPFLQNREEREYQLVAARSGSEDVLMPDYSHSNTPSSSRNISGSHNMHRKLPSLTQPFYDDQYDLLVDALSARKDGTSGTFAPANTRISSTSAPNVASRSSAAAEAMPTSCSQRHGSRSATLPKSGPSVNRKPSDISMPSLFSEGTVVLQDLIDGKIPTKPAGNVKGKKEGRGSDIDARQREISTDSVGRTKKGSARKTKGSPKSLSLSDAKRKRILTSSENTPLAKATDALSSPTRKMSRMESPGAHVIINVDDITDEEEMARTPLGIMENVR